MTHVKRKPDRSASRIGIAMLLVAIVAGCSNRPPREDAPDWSPQTMADAAVTQLDTSGDGKIDDEEVLQAPGLAEAFDLLDADHDGHLSAEEIESRLELYEKMKTAFVRTSVEVRMDGRPLPGVFVKLSPEPFQGDIVLPATGMTDHVGIAAPKTEGQAIPAMQPGFYQVDLYRDSSAAEPITVKRPLGIESSPQTRPGRDSTIVLNFERG